MKLVRVTSPSSPLTRGAAKTHLRWDGTDEDTLIDDLIAAATRWCEEESELSFLTQSWRLSLDAFPSGVILLRRPPVSSISSVTYYDTDGVQQTLDPAVYQLDADAWPAEFAIAPGQTWPAIQTGRLSAVQIEYSAGVADVAQVDPRATQAIRLLVGHWFENREAVVTGTIATELQSALEALLRQLWPGAL